ncbi:5-formyltetrahydrofolate cyclo-ligase [Spiroplasma syrphidicola EA-1]|uniref:5-formyltetrahydrofolate cyclo-ligase n=1 Tax=Spiroplasma syrphidicola EA-1 TaxID=1276229 RepID=R4UMQ9_9MOLU|nr:5-formyltetrahydrofolate cyclo-ligase [Spiroplasma syrphidicola]AGM26541.1 5-formyltetrahydrofolate cyclo-ligase [Spiroplasma syrphidicola EA-1]
MPNEKKTLRKNNLQKRQNIEPGLHQRKTAKIVKKVLAHPRVKTAKIIGVYYAINNEVRTVDLIKALLAKGKIVCLPRINDQELTFFAINSLVNTLEPHRVYQSLLEPKESNPKIKDKNELDVIITPVVSYDDDNNRLGYGGGFYDRFFADYQGFKMGLAFYEQKHSTLLPTEQNDVKLDEIIAG